MEVGSLQARDVVEVNESHVTDKLNDSSDLLQASGFPTMVWERAPDCRLGIEALWLRSRLVLLSQRHWLQTPKIPQIVRQTIPILGLLEYFSLTSEKYSL